MGQIQSVILFKMELLIQAFYNLVLSLVYLWEPFKVMGVKLKYNKRWLSRATLEYSDQRWVKYNILMIQQTLFGADISIKR